MHYELWSFFFTIVHIELRLPVDIPIAKEARKIFQLCRTFLLNYFKNIIISIIQSNAFDAIKNLEREITKIVTCLEFII